MLTTLATILSTLAVIISGWVIPSTLSNQDDLDNIKYQIQSLEIENESNAEATQKLGSTLPIAGQTYTLAGSGVSSAATSITLSSFTLPQTGYEILDADLSSTFYVTLEPGNRTKQEVASCTTVTQNANDTATLSGCTRGLLPITPFTASSTYAFAHGGGTSVIFSNPPQLYNQFTAKDNDETITGTWTFNNFPITASTTYASETVTGSVQLATALETASSTIGGATSPLVLSSRYSTSTPSASGHVVPVTGIDGNLAEGFLPTTLVQNYGFDGEVKIIGTTYGAILSPASIASSDKTFTFPNTTGTLALTSDILASANIKTSSTTLNISTLGTASTTVFAHGLGSAPGFVRISGISGTNGGAANKTVARAEANWTSSGQSSITSVTGSGSNTGSNVLNSFRLYDAIFVTKSIFLKC